jgi:hypothetical protein
MAQYTYKYFDITEDVLSGKQKTKTFPIWTDTPTDADTNPEAILTSFYTASYEKTNWESNYFYNIYQSDTGISGNYTYNLPIQFSISVGTSTAYQLKNSDASLQLTYPSWAIYRQFVNALTDGGSTTKIQINGKDVSYLYALSVSRARLKDGVEPDTWLLKLSGSAMLTLVNAPATVDGTNEYDIVVSGSTNVIGRFYSKQGLFLFDGANLYASGALSVNPATALTSSYDPSVILTDFYKSLVGGAYFKARTTEKVQSTIYFVRAKNYEYNLTPNPTWVSGSDNTVLSDFYEDPKTFVTTVGLYDGYSEGGRLVAVAKLSRPLLKTPESEILLKIRLDF